VTVLAQALAASALEPQGRGVEKSNRNGAEQRLAMPVERLFDRLGGAAAIVVDRTEPGHRLIGMVEIEPVGARHAQTTAPVAGVAIGARNHQPVQHSEIDRALDIESKTPVGEQAVQHVATTRLGPKPAKHQVGSDAEAMQFWQVTAIKTRQYDRAARMACRRGDQPIDQSGGLDLVAPAQRLDDTLHVAAALARVLDEVEVLVGSDLLDADKHGAAPCFSVPAPRFSGREQAKSLRSIAIF
jgi:hypothetical protein